MGHWIIILAGILTQGGLVFAIPFSSRGANTCEQDSWMTRAFGREDDGGETPMGALSQQSIREHYLALKKNYVDSGRCHLFARHSPLEQSAFFSWLLKYELDAISGNNPALGRDQAFEIFGAYLGWSESRVQSWKSDRGSLTEQRIRLIHEIHQKSNHQAFRELMLPRVKWHFDRVGVKDCDDFVSFDVFEAAMRSRAKNLNSINPSKRHLLTVFDRSQRNSDRRMLVIDLSQDQVLLHTIAGFGDGSVGGRSGKESSRCSNAVGSGLSPEGPAITSKIGRASNGNFRGEGVFLSIPDGKGGWSGSRGLAIHSMSAYHALNLGTSSEQEGVGRYYDQILRGKGDKNTLDGFLHSPVSPVEVRVPATDGCVGVPDDMMDQVRSTLTGGEFLYFHCPK